MLTDAFLVGRHGGRGTLHAGYRDVLLALDHAGLDATPEQIEKVRRLYERPGTPGEKAAAREALRRMGVDPDRPGPSSSASSSSRPQTQSQSGRWHVRVAERRSGRLLFEFNFGGNLSEQEARQKAIAKARDDWKLTTGKAPPELVIVDIKRS